MSLYQDKQDRSLTLTDVERVQQTITELSKLTIVPYDASVKVWDEHTEQVIAEVWWDGENELWLVDFDQKAVQE